MEKLGPASGYSVEVARKVALFYAVLALVWIIVSDGLVFLTGEEDWASVLLNSTKGVLFVLVSATLIYLYMTRWMQRSDREREELIRHFGHLSRFANDAVFLTDAQGRVIEANDRAETMYGWSRGELRGRLFASFFIDEKSWQRDWDWVLAQGRHVFVSRHRTKDDVPLDVEVSAREVETAGRLLVQAVVRDIGERVEAERRIMRLKDIYAALSQTNQAIVRCREQNDLFQAICRIAIDFGGFKLAWIGLTNPETLQVEQQCWAGEAADYMQGHMVFADPNHHFGRGPTGKAMVSGQLQVLNDINQSTDAAPFHDRTRAFGLVAAAAFPLWENGRTVGTLTLYSGQDGFFTADIQDLLAEMAADISFALDQMSIERHRQQLEKELHQTVDRLSAVNAELERFAYVASHDLQEPLRAITSFTQLLERSLGPGLTPEEREYLSYVTTASQRMHALIRDLLSYSRVTVKGGQLKRASLAEACQAALDNLRESIADSGAAVEVGDLPMVQADPIQMMQVFQNLIGNALKFRAPDRPPIVRVQTRRQGNDWLVSVSDNGIGMEETEQDIFEIFRRLHTHRSYPGTGIGLAICKRIVLRHQGRIWAESKNGEGATFYFTIPVLPEDREEEGVA